jgi:hypothetical protein
VWLSAKCVARSSRLPLRSSPRVKTKVVPAAKATLDAQTKSFGAQTKTAGSASPMK